MKRSKWKGSWDTIKGLESLGVKVYKDSDHKPEGVEEVIRLVRSGVIQPNMINKVFEVHNGNSTKRVKITKDHVGHKIGEFYHSKKTALYKKKK